VNPPLQLLLPLKLGSVAEDAADQVERTELQRAAVRLALGDRQRLSDAVEIAESPAEPACVADPPVDRVPDSHLSYLIMIMRPHRL
jgi:hypothetical protein